MLFPLNHLTPRCKVFEKLNAELLFFLQKSISGKRFVKSLFSRETGIECWENEPTQEKFKAVFKALPISEIDRRALYNLISNNQNLSNLFRDKTVVIPIIAPVSLFNALKALTTHLFNHSKDLAGVVRVAGESIGQHYQTFLNLNSQLCFLCGTEALSQNRVNINVKKQWRADYDHLLCKDKYPAFSCHPDNFIPTCHTCNSRAKGADDMLREKTSRRRRKVFYPLSPLLQSFHHLVEVEVEFSDIAGFAVGGINRPLNAARLSYISPTPDEAEMIKAWIDLYQVPKRVGDRLTKNFCEYIDGDCAPENYEDFCNQAERKASREPRDMQSTEWRFWWYRLYQWLHTQGYDVKGDAWALIEWKQRQVNNNNDAAQTFGI
jgi:hypothetical protein